MRAHCGILGNEIADKAANHGNSNVTSVLSLLTNEELYSLLNSRFVDHWRLTLKSGIILSSKGKYLSTMQSCITNNSWMKLESRRVECVVAKL